MRMEPWKADGTVFTGYLPKDQNVANTATEWSGVHWTQLLWPLPDEQSKRDTLIAHELFHRVQDQLKLPNVTSGDNAQLDTVDGRYYLQLEWRALARALDAPIDADRRQAVKSAILFRAERHRLFPQAVQQERALELNEGLAEYTGVRVGSRFSGGTSESRPERPEDPKGGTYICTIFRLRHGPVLRLTVRSIRSRLAPSIG